MIKGAMEVRQQSDYEDFYVVSREFAEKQLQNVNSNPKQTILNSERQALED